MGTLVQRVLEGRWPDVESICHATNSKLRVILKNMFRFNCHDKVSKDLRASQFRPFSEASPP